MQKFLGKVSEVFSAQTTNASSVARQIVFALFAFIWAISYHDNKLNIADGSYAALFSLIIYLMADISQSAFASIMYRRIFYNYRRKLTVENTPKTEEEIVKERSEFQEKCDEIDSITFYFLLFKVILIPIAMIGIVYDLIRMM